MEYVFGTIKVKGIEVDILKTVGSEHTNLSGKHIIERKYSDCIITDSFFVNEHYLSKDGADGKKYDWYTLTNHSRYIDYFTPKQSELEDGIAEAQNATCELSEELDERITDLENALCELTEE